MNITLKRVGIALLLASALSSATTVFAQSGLQYVSGYGAQNDDKNRSNQDRRSNDDRRQSAVRPSDSNANRNAEQYRRDPKMSPDERRALRREIDEVGRDIYAPRR